MLDRKDPNSLSRPLTGRKNADPRRGPTTEGDPLAEFAKVVQGRPGAASGRSRPEPPKPAQHVETDLETELMNDLQASFALIRDLAAKPVAPTPPVEPPAAEAVAAPEPEFAPEPYIAAEPEPPVATSATAAPEPDLRFEPPMPPPQPAAPRSERRSAPPEAPRPVRPAPPRDDFSDLQMRSTTPPPRQPHSRWEKPEPARAEQPRRQPEKEKAPATSRFAPRQERAAPPPEPVFDDEFDDPFEDDHLIAEAPDLGPPEDEFPLDAFAATTGFGDDDDFAAFTEDTPRSRERRGPPRGLAIAAAVLAVAVIGAGVLIALRPSGGLSNPPTIVADGSPTKITPDEPAASDKDSGNKLIYDRVAPADKAPGTTLDTPPEAPVSAVPAGNGDDNPITRVILPGGPGTDSGSGDNGLPLDGQPSMMGDNSQAAPDESDDSLSALGPRKVRTVVVKPDGTIVSSAAVDATPDEPNVVAPAPSAAAPHPASTGSDIAAITGKPGADELPISEDVTDQTQTATPAPAPKVPASVPMASAKQPVTSAPQSDPMDLTKTGTDVATATPVPAGGVLVQVSSQRTEDAARATFRDLQARFPRILGQFGVNIQRADIGERGTFFRVRVGPFSARDAERLCDDLKSAGGDCILVR